MIDVVEILEQWVQLAKRWFPELMVPELASPEFANAACRRGYEVCFAKCSRVLADLAGRHADGSWELRLRRWAKAMVRTRENPPFRVEIIGPCAPVYGYTEADPDFR